MTAEYLDRSSLVARMKYYEEHTTEGSGEHYAYLTALREIRNAPAADVAPVVRCEDCQNWKRNVGLTDSPNGHCFEHDIDTNGRDFCSYGERKDNDEH